MNKKEKRSRFYYIFALSRYISSYWLKFIISIMIHIIFKVIPVAISFLTAYTVGMALTDRMGTAKACFPYLFLLLLSEALFYYLDIYVSHDIAYRILTELRAASYKAVNRIAPAAMYGKRSGDIVSVVMDDINVLEWFYAHTIGQWLVAILLPFTAIIILGFFSYKLALVILPFVCFLFLIPAFFAKESDLQGKALRENLGNLNAQLVDGVQGLADILSFQWRKGFLKKFMKINHEYHKANMAYAKRSARETALIFLSIGFATLAFQAVSIYLVLNKKLDIVWLLPLFCLISLVFGPILETMSLSRNYGMIFAAAKRVFALLQEKSSVADNGSLSSLSFDKIESLELENISFSYPTQEGEYRKEVLSDIGFSLKKGEHIVLVGASGSGKSTIARLIQRFYDADKGSIRLNGTDIREFSLSALRKMLTVIPQEIYLFNRSIKENLLLAKKGATKLELEEALKKAQAMEIINKLPKGEDSIVGEKGLKLSGGEKARLAIAQAFLKDSPILIMDEAAANLDSENESKINKAIEELKQGRITLSIAHRLSTIKTADRIVLLKDGMVEAQGSFEILIENSAYFRKLIGKEC